MDSTDPLVASMRSAVQAAPSDIPLRRHLAALLAQNALHDEAILHAAAALHAAPRDEDSRTLMRRLLDETEAASEAAPEAMTLGRPDVSPAAAAPGFTGGLSAAVPLAPRPPMEPPARRRPVDRAYGASARAARSEPGRQPQPEPQPEPQLDVAAAIVQAQELAHERAQQQAHTAALAAVSDQRADALPPASGPDLPMYPQGLLAGVPDASPARGPRTGSGLASETPESPEPLEPAEFVPDARWAALADLAPDPQGDAEPHRLAWDLEQVHVTLADVGGMGSAKERLEAAVLAPVRHPELLRLYRHSLTGGVLLYGPPGCGKTFMARAVAGELDAGFVHVRVRDIIEPASGTDSGDLGDIFEAARAQAPVLLLLEDIDVLSRRRTSNRHAAQAVARIVAELDSGDLTDAGVYVLATTCAPWAVDDDLRRSGRLGRPLLVLPPDQGAREFVLRQELVRIADGPADLPLTEVSLRTEGYSCTDLEWLCTLAASSAARARRPISENDLRAMLPRIAPSTQAWMSEAARVATEHADDPFYRELREYLRARRG